MSLAARLVEQWLPAPVRRDFFGSRLFLGVLVLKIALGTTAASHFLRDLFIPFVNYFVLSGFHDPWKHFFDIGRIDAFPYPPVMLYVLALPRLLFAPLLPGDVNAVGLLHLFVFRLPMLGFDLLIALILLKWFPHRASRVLTYYWCSPFVVYINYWHGQLDIIPTGIFLLSLHFLRERRHRSACVALGLALAAKSHLLVAVPFVAVHLWDERGWKDTLGLLATVLATYLAAVFPFVLRPEYAEMVYNNAQQARLTAYQIQLHDTGSTLFLAPAAMLLLWLRFVAYRKRNWDLFMLYMGLLFSTFILLAPPAQGYFLWSVPFVVYFLCREATPNVWPYAIYGAAYLFYFWSGSSSDLFDAWRTMKPAVAAWPSPSHLLSQLTPDGGATIRGLGFTVMQAALAGLTANMYLLGVRSNAVYRMRAHPVMFGIAGDSAAGKDHLAASVIEVLGEENSLLVSGDDYHRWPRGDGMWSVYTHLDVRGNRLDEQHRHAVALSRGKPVIKGTYDHETGRFSEDRVVDPGRYVVFCGLHALSHEDLRDLYDLKIFMDPDEELRRSWKIERDSRARGYSAAEVIAALERREPDRVKYILPQGEKSDLTIRWTFDGSLQITALNSFDLAPCAQQLAATGSLHVEHDPYVDARIQQLRLEGTAGADAVRRVANLLVPNLDEISAKPQFREGLEGCLQLIVLICLSHRLRLNQLKAT